MPKSINEQKKRQFVHNTDVEKMYFEEFIRSALGVDKDYSITFKSQGFDAVFIEDKAGFFEDPFRLEIKYTNNPQIVSDFILNNESKLTQKLLVVSLLSKKDIEGLSIPNTVKVWGRDDVAKLATDNLEKWWIFVSSCSPSGTVYYDEETESIKIDCEPPLAATVVFPRKEIYLKKDSVGKLSVVCENEFKKLRKNGRKKVSIIIGNGVSMAFGSDLWTTMTDSLLSYLSPKYVDNVENVKNKLGGTTYSCTSLAKYIIDPSKYYDAIYNSVYKRYEPSMHTGNTLIRSITKVKNSNPDIGLITYNYDNFLELDSERCNKQQGWNVICPVYSFRTDNKKGEPKVKHVHGYMPLKKTSKGKQTKRNKLVLTQEEYFEKYSDKRSWTFKVQKKALHDDAVLFVGSSMSDIFQMSIIEEVRMEYLKKGQAWNCFALLCLNSLSPKDKVALFNYYLSRGVHLIFTDSFRELPNALSDLFK